MNVSKSNRTDNETVLIISGDAVELEPIRQHVLKAHFANDVKVAGFRQGKAPLNLVEKNIDQSLYQSRFLDEALNQLYQAAVQQEKLKPIDQPKVELKKFVPFTLLEFEAVVPVLGDVKLPDYKKIRLAKKAPQKVTDSDIEKVIENIKKQLAERKDVAREVKNGDQVFIDFSGVDEKGQAVKGADAKNYPLMVGSDSFIPGFESNLVGLKAGQSKTFTLTFPKDYGVKALANRKVTFSVNVIKVQELIEPEANDQLASKVGPFKTLSELKLDIRNQLTIEKQNEVDREYESELLKLISSKSSLNVPEILVDQEIEARLKDLKLNLSYRGQTFEEFLASEKTDEKTYIDKVLKPEAKEKLKASIVLSEISEIEMISLSDEEINQRMAAMRAQFKDSQSQEELSKPEARQNIASRVLAEKTIKQLTEYATR